MDIKKEIIESIDIIVEERFKKTTKIFYGLVNSVNNNECNISLNGKTYDLPIYGGGVSPNKTYVVVIPQNNMNNAFVIGGSAVSSVSSVNGKTGAVQLNASDVGALPDTTYIPTNSDIVNLIYPVGSIYMSINSTSPQILFGGTWTQIEDTFLLSAGQTYTAGDTGGEAEHTLTIDEMPEHNHSVARGTGTGTTEWGLVRFNNLNSSADTTRIGKTGGGQPHNNMPPYLVVYMWKRIQ